MNEDQNTAKKHDIAALNGMYIDGDSADQAVFAEQRSNLLLVAGEHYNRRQSMFYRRIRDTRDLQQEQKLRLTKNHIQRICKLYANNITSMSPNVGFEPKDDQSIQDQKAAVLHHAVWRDAMEKYDLDSKIDEWCDNFIQVGETILKMIWDPNQGKVVSYEQKLSDEGNPLYKHPSGELTVEPGSYDEYGNEVPHEPLADEQLPVFEGGFVFETVYGFNLLRPPQARTMNEAEWLCVRKMVNIKDMQIRYAGDEEKQKCFVQSGQDTFVIFDNSQNGYKKVDGQAMVREYYFRPSQQYPRGYFYFTTKEGIFEEGELPGGIFPIIYQGFDQIQTTPRGRSPIKHMRPYQIEINRAASKIAEHQVTLGDDKLLIQNGTKISAGVALPGVRAINYTGTEPDILAGRSGEQYLGYMQSQISELYMVMNVEEDAVTKDMQLDPNTLLYRAASQKKAFQRYIKRFEFFLIQVVKTYLGLAKIHLPENQMIYAIGKSEMVNIAEFKNTNDVCYQIIVEAQSDDIESKLGKQISLSHILQYVGPQMKPEDIGKVIRQLPYVNSDEAFDDLTIDYDSAKNLELALDRGEFPQPNPYDAHVFIIKRLTMRMRKPDFKYLSPQIQQMYAQRISMHEELEAQRQVQIQRAQQGYIPTGGALLGCDFFVTDPANPTKTRRARLPSEAVQWLVKNLEAQGQGLEQIEGMNPGAQAEIAGKMGMQQGGQQPEPRPGVSHTSVAPRNAAGGMGQQGGQGPQPPIPLPNFNGMKFQGP